MSFVSCCLSRESERSSPLGWCNGSAWFFGGGLPLMALMAGAGSAQDVEAEVAAPFGPFVVLFG